MAALVQTIPQQAGTITLLQPRPSSSSATLGGSSSQQHQHQHSQSQMARNQQHPRASYNGGNVGSLGYRQMSTQPVAPYAFTSTPGLASGHSQPRHNGTLQPLSDSNPAHQNPSFPGVIPPRSHYPTAGSVSNSSSSASSLGSQRSKDDSSLPRRHNNLEPNMRPLSAIDLTLPSHVTPPTAPTTTTTTTPTAASSPSKPSPDRYRRPQRRAESNGNVSLPSNTTSPNIPSPPVPDPSDTAVGKSLIPNFTPILQAEQKNHGSHHGRGVSVDSVQVDRTPNQELAKRYRRRSLGSIDTPGLVNFATSQPASSSNKISLPELSFDNDQSFMSPSQSGKEVSTPNQPKSSTQSPRQHDPKSASNTTETPKRSTNPSPLSRPLDSEKDTPSPATSDVPVTNGKPQTSSQQAKPTQPAPQSPAAKRLTELSKKNPGKGGKSRLRRALSFSSVAELRGASNATADSPKELSRKEQLDQELGAEQAAIAVKQEQSGLGESIYSGQGNVFSASTDNISVSSTASSASIMLRKMGKGVKRSTRSLVGLFRPKSIHNAPIDTAPIEPMVPQVSMVNVEAQRDHDNFDGTAATAVDHTNGPASRRVSAESVNAENGRDENGDASRKSILGGDKERAEVLATLKKGILKKSMPMPGSSSPVIRPRGRDSSPARYRNVDSPRSSAPGTPVEDRPPQSGHRRTDSVTIEGEDYFLPPGRFNAAGTNSAPVTPQGGQLRNISFSPRIQFHDTWPSGEYDRRGDVATCNRLTPLLAQQIKEELNTFKMEMEVHESSKIYTHFF